MSGFTITRRVHAPQDRVFQIFTDFEKAPERIEAIEKIEILTEGPVGIGTRFRETRVIHGKRATEEMEITRFEQGEGYVVACESHGCEFTSAFLLFADGDEVDRCKVEVLFEAKPKTLMARLMVALMMKAMRKEFERDFDALQKVAETPDAA